MCKLNIKESGTDGNDTACSQGLVQQVRGGIIGESKGKNIIMIIMM